MEPLLSAYTEITDKEAAADLVRELGDSGYHSIELSTLSPGFRLPDDVGAAPRLVTLRYLLRGISLGAIGGVLIALVVFMIPATYMHVPYPLITLIASVLVCGFMGAGVGVLEALTLAKRSSPEPVGAQNRETVGIRVRVETLSDLSRVRAILAHFPRVSQHA